MQESALYNRKPLLLTTLVAVTLADSISKPMLASLAQKGCHIKTWIQCWRQSQKTLISRQYN